MFKELCARVNEVLQLRLGYSARNPANTSQDLMTIPFTATLTGLLALLLVFLAARISMLRMRHKISLGDGGNPELLRAIRLHANTAEHVPLYLLLSLGYEMTAGADTWLLALNSAFFVSRLAYTWGMMVKGVTRRRQLATLVTYLCQSALAALLLWRISVFSA